MTTEEIEKAASNYSDKGAEDNYAYISPEYRKLINVKHDAFKAGVEYATKYWQEKSVEMFNKQRRCVHEWQPLWDSNSSLTSVKHRCLKCGEIQ